MKKYYTILFITIIAHMICGCGGSRKFSVSAPMPDDRRDIPKPEEKKILLYVDTINKLFALPMRHAFELTRYGRKLAGSPKQAMNVDAFDEVSDSS